MCPKCDGKTTRDGNKNFQPEMLPQKMLTNLRFCFLLLRAHPYFYFQTHSFNFFEQTIKNKKSASSRASAPPIYLSFYCIRQSSLATFGKLRSAIDANGYWARHESLRWRVIQLCGIEKYHRSSHRWTNALLYTKYNLWIFPTAGDTLWFRRTVEDIRV